MEEELDVKLLERHNRTFSLTPAGEHFYRKSLAESTLYVKISAKNPLSKLSCLEITDLKNTPCILVMNQVGQKEEQEYYESIIGLHGEFLFADTIQEARLKIVTGQGYMPVDVIGEQTWFDTAVFSIPLVRNGESVKKTYCAFWKKVIYRVHFIMSFISLSLTFG